MEVLQYSADWDLWIPRYNVHPELIKEFEQSNDPMNCTSKISLTTAKYVIYLVVLQAGSRSTSTYKFHQTEKKQNFKDSLVSESVKNKKLEESRSTRDTVMIRGKELEKVSLFKYLGSLFAPNGMYQRDIKTRIDCDDER